MSESTPANPGLERRTAAGLGLAFAMLALVVYAPALGGAFLSDDVGYIVTNRHVHELTLANLLAILDPWGDPALYTVNWAPVHLLGHAAEWALWGRRTFGYHVVNVLLHAGASTLLVALFVRRGFPLWASGLAGLVFLLHPANVEAVAWIFQLKTILALIFVLGALLAHPRRPLLASGLFALGLLSKAAASFALPVALAFAWVARDASDPWRTRVRWLGLWALLLVGYAVPQFFTFGRTGMVEGGLHADPLVAARTMVAIGARYLAMATTSWGTAAFHEPPRALSWLDPWWLAGLGLGLAIAARWGWTLLRRREEAVWWTWAAAAYAPVSQIFPFLYPMADRYLYTVLPGLLGVAMLFLGRAGARFGGAFPPGASARRVATAAVLLLALGFAVRSHGRAQIWRNEGSLNADTVRAYPDGIASHVVQAARAARRGDAPGAAVSARRAYERGFHRFLYFYETPDFAPVRDDADFQAVLREMAGAWIEATRDMTEPAQADLRVLALAHWVRGDLERSETLLKQALQRGGAFDELVLRDLAAVQARLREERLGRAPESR